MIITRVTRLSKISGLMFKKKIKPIYFETRWGLHTFFVPEPIDVIILDEIGEVVKVVENLKPNRILLWNPKYNRVVELPKGFICKNKIKAGTQLTFNKQYTSFLLHSNKY